MTKKGKEGAQARDQTRPDQASRQGSRQARQVTARQGSRGQASEAVNQIKAGGAGLSDQVLLGVESNSKHVVEVAGDEAGRRLRQVALVVGGLSICHEVRSLLAGLTLPEG